MTPMQEVFTAAGWMMVEGDIPLRVAGRSNKEGNHLRVVFFRKGRSTAAIVEWADRRSLPARVGIVTRYAMDAESPRLGRKMALTKALQKATYLSMEDRAAVWEAVVAWEDSPPLIDRPPLRSAAGEVLVETPHQAPQRFFGAPGMGRMKLPSQLPLVDDIPSTEGAGDQICS